MIDRQLCGCGAGFCRLEVVTTGGPNFGRKFYVCPIKKGQGACSYFMWQDADPNVAAPGLRSDESVIAPLSTLTNFIKISPSSDSGLVEEIHPINLGEENASQCSNNLLPKFGLLKRNNFRLGELKGSEGISGEPLTRHSKRLRQGDSESDDSPSGSSSISLSLPLENSRNCLTLSSSPTLETEFHHGQTGFPKHSHTNEEPSSLAAYENFLSFCHHSSTLLIDYEILRNTCWMLAAFCENLPLQIQGWWGRLAFPPSRCLTEPAQRPFFCGILPSFDPFFVPPNVYLLIEAAPLAGSNTAEPACSQGNSIMRKFVSKAFVKAAEEIQTDLLNILRPLDIKDHEIMTQEANAAFGALDCLGTDHEKFREQVKEFIQYASLLAKIDQSIPTNHSCKKLADRFNRQKLKLHEIKDAIAKVIDALSASVQRAAYFTEEISNLKDKLCEAEVELSCCKAESTALEARIAQMSKDKVKREQSLEKTCHELKNAWKLCEQVEAEKQAAKTAFEKAKVLLWG